MSKRNKTYEVTSLSKVNTELYKNGDLFYTNRSIGVLHNGKIKTIGSNTPDMTDYVKRDEVQQMIDEAVSNLGGDSNE